MPCDPEHGDDFVSLSHIRTDLAVEARETLLKEGDISDLPGVDMDVEEFEEITVKRIRISHPRAAYKLGKPIGSYITLEVPGLRHKDAPLHDRASQVLARELHILTGLNNNATIMVVGLGNWNVTPDALGPKTIQDILVTSHIFKTGPDKLGTGFRSVSALSPGVLGLTGIETREIIKSVVNHINPDLVIAVDALAAQRIERLFTVIQLSDTGITPGSGVGNRRLGINRESLGVPVIAIGVPTVVDVVTIINDSLEAVLDSLKKGASKESALVGALKGFNWGDRRALLQEILEPYTTELIVTPKEIDALIEDISRIISGGINAALHPEIKAEQAEKYLH